MLNAKKSPIEDVEIEEYLANIPLNFHATLDKEVTSDSSFMILVISLKKKITN